MDTVASISARIALARLIWVAVVESSLVAAIVLSISGREYQLQPSCRLDRSLASIS
jgi:hypothetical protein